MTTKNRDASLEDLVIGAALALKSLDDLNPVKILKGLKQNDAIREKLKPLRFIERAYPYAINAFSDWVMTQPVALMHLQTLYDSIADAPTEKVQEIIRLQVGYEASYQLRSTIEKSAGYCKREVVSNGTFYRDIPTLNLKNAPDKTRTKAAFFVYDSFEVPYINTIAASMAQRRNLESAQERLRQDSIVSNDSIRSVLGAMRLADDQRVQRKEALLKDKDAICALLTQQVYLSLGVAELRNYKA